MSRLNLNYYSINRTFCDVLAALRKCNETRNYSIMLSLVEELQTYGNRMEAHLYDSKDVKNLHTDIALLKIDRKKLLAEVKGLRKTDEEK